ncbi:substrate-binding periplasmic protein [Aestuariibius sp. HNIBRBA575]|uniref:substrate-binding periplasmic protein n=1 Tax=Aestuariibius sp. HNIBRBA575 TaxID=3233343 RepID=UPI0034A3E854
MNFSLKKLFVSLIAALTLGMANIAVAAEYNFVRIQGLAEQAVGARLLEEVYNRAGLEITITEMPGRRALEEAASGRMDGETLRIFALGENHPTLIRVPTPLSDLQTVAFRQAGTDMQVTSAQELENYSNAIVMGVLHTRNITQDVDNVHEVRNSDALFRLVQSGRVDFALSSNLDGRANLAQHGITGVEMVSPALATLQLYHYVHESKADIIPMIDEIIIEMRDSGELAQLREQFEAEFIAAAAAQ